MGIRQVDTSQLYSPKGIFSLAVTAQVSGELLFVSGLTARRPDGSIVGQGSMAAQTEQVLQNLSGALNAAGRTFADIAKLTVYVTDMASYAAVQEVRERYFTPPYPAAALVQVAALAHPDLMIEIDAIAV